MRKPIKWDKLKLGAQMMITDAMIENMGFDGNTKVNIERSAIMRAILFNVVESFLAKRLKRIERRYIEIPTRSWLYKLIPQKYKKKLIIDITQIIPLPTNTPHAIIYSERDTFTTK